MQYNTTFNGRTMQYLPSIGIPCNILPYHVEQLCGKRSPEFTSEDVKLDKWKIKTCSHAREKSIQSSSVRCLTLQWDYGLVV